MEDESRDADDSRDDAALLREYRAGSQAAFATLVARHAGWVRATAARRLGGDAQRADDVAQAVFLLLAQRGPTEVRSEATMAAWIFRTLRRAAANVAREESRRRRREAIAARPEAASTPDDVWAEVAPGLDACVDALPARDREAILLRFYRRHSHEAVGAAMGISAEGSRKRIARAIERLRTMLARTGVAVPAVALTDAMTVHVAPPTTPFAVAASPTPSVAAIARAAMAKPALAYAAAGIGAAVAAGAVAVAVATSGPSMPAAAAAVRPPPPTTFPAVLTLDALLGAVGQSERAIATLEVGHFRADIRERGPKDADWVSKGLYASGKALYDDRGPLRRVRVDLDHEVSEWTGGAAPTFDGPSTYAWDGREGVRITPWAKQATREADGTSGTGNLYNSIAGLTNAFSVDGAFNLAARSPSLSERLRELADVAARNGGTVAVMHGRVGDLATIRLTVTFQLDRPEPRFGPAGFTQSSSYWFAPSRGYACVQIDTRQWRDGGVTEGWMGVDAMTEAAPGVWLPTRATRIDFSDQPSWLCYRRDYTAGGYVVNDPAFDAGRLALSIPADYAVQDRRGPTTRP